MQPLWWMGTRRCVNGEDRFNPHRTYNVVTVYWDNGGLNVVCATVIYDIILLTPSGHGIAHNPTHTHTHTHTHLKLDHMTSLHVIYYLCYVCHMMSRRRGICVLAGKPYSLIYWYMALISLVLPMKVRGAQGGTRKVMQTYIPQYTQF